jgi:hypothetical protein
MDFSVTKNCVIALNTCLVADNIDFESRNGRHFGKRMAGFESFSQSHSHPTTPSSSIVSNDAFERTSTPFLAESVD